MENSKSRKVFKYIGVPLIAGSLLLSLTPVVANANTSGGTGGGGGSGGGSNFYWKSAKGSNAYEAFAADTGYTKSYTEQYLKNTGASLSTCKNSNVIWYIKSTGSGKWSHNYNSYTNGSRWSGAGSIQKPHRRIGAAPSTAEYSAFVAWDRDENGQKINKRPGYTIICSGYFDKRPDQVKKNVRVGGPTKTVTNRDSVSYTRPYSVTTSVTPQINPKGLLEAQSANKKTAFGKLWDDSRNNKNISPNQLRSRVTTAVNKDKNLVHASVDLNNNNQKGIAEGGVMNVSEQTRYATITANSETTRTRVRYCDQVRKWDMEKRRYGSWQNTNCRNSDSFNTVYNSSVNQGTQEQTGFWQILGVQCNIDGFNDLVASDNSLNVIQRLNTDEDTPGIVKTKKYTKQPSRLDFGDTRNANSAKAATADAKFYTEECSFMCTAEPNNNMSNGSDTNVNDNGARDASEYGFGAVHENRGEQTNAGFFNQFRDNQDQQYTLDIWYPDVGDVNGVEYDGAEAVSTRWIVNEDGTPKEDAKFHADGEELSIGEVTKLNGVSRTLDARASWASEENKPHRVSTIWNYNVTTNPSVPDTVGFGRAGAQLDEGRTSIPVEKEAICYASFNGENAKAQDVTSRGAETNPEDYDTYLQENTDNGPQYELELNFQRSIAEGRD